MPRLDGKLAIRTPKRFRSIQGVRRFVATVLVRLDDETLDVDRARVMIYGAKVLSELIQGGEIEARVTALERKAVHGERSVQ